MLSKKDSVELLETMVAAHRFAKQSRQRKSVEHNGCKQCLSPHGPSHEGSKRCRSGSIASGGNRSHCTCDTCY